MDHVHGILTALPVTKPSTNSAAKAYDISIRQHVATLTNVFAEIRRAVLSNPENLLEVCHAIFLPKRDDYFLSNSDTLTDS